jgi:uncharacterized protein with HEPN domain
MSKLISPYLHHILDEAIFLAETFKSRAQADLYGDRLLQLASVKSLEIIGEATKKLPMEFRRAHSQIPWRVMAAMRDLLTHNYTGVSYARVYRTIMEDIPPLIGEMEKLLKEMKED